MARVTLQTIADRVGVSRMTVSNAFSRPDQLSSDLRDQILAAAQELGYVGPDPAARALARGTAGAVGVLLTDSLRYAFTDEVATGFLGAIVDELAPSGVALTLLTSDERGEAVPARDVAVDGAVVYSCLPQSNARDWLLRRHLPLVYVDQDPDPEIPSINVDDRGGARLAATHLVELGHRRIGVLTLAVAGTRVSLDDDAESAAVPHPQRERLLGTLEVLRGHGIEPAIEHAERHGDEEAQAAAHLLLAGPERPTGVLCFSDVLALGVIRAAHELGLEVPGDVSVVGFDDSPVAARNEPGITTVRQDVAAKGRLAAVELTAAIERAREADAADASAPPPAEIAHHVLPTELVIRGTTAPPPI
ncbi:MAG TPA: LacI family DNA-binding transcriptional regulator [Acidimicrobiales bacterium]